VAKYDGPPNREQSGRSRSKAMRVGSNLCRNRYERSHALSGEETGACFVIYLFIGVQRDQAPVVYRSSW